MILPSALPTIFVGLRTAVSISFYTLVAAELAGAFAGLAYRIDLAHQNMQTGQMLGGLVMLGLVSAAADRGFATAVAPAGVVELTRWASCCRSGPLHRTHAHRGDTRADHDRQTSWSRSATAPRAGWPCST